MNTTTTTTTTIITHDVSVTFMMMMMMMMMKRMMMMMMTRLMKRMMTRLMKRMMAGLMKRMTKRMMTTRTKRRACWTNRKPVSRLPTWDKGPPLSTCPFRTLVAVRGFPQLDQRRQLSLVDISSVLRQLVGNDASEVASAFM